MPSAKSTLGNFAFASPIRAVGIPCCLKILASVAPDMTVKASWGRPLRRSQTCIVLFMIAVLGDVCDPSIVCTRFVLKLKPSSSAKLCIALTSSASTSSAFCCGVKRKSIKNCAASGVKEGIRFQPDSICAI